MKVKRALISVSDKTGLEGFLRGLFRLGVETISTGGTAASIKALGFPVIELSAYTGFPEMLEGRVKTLHPGIHGAILALRANKKHMDELKAKGIGPIDMVVVNLYPFEGAIKREGITEKEALENIDIGGPAMLRSAAKNFKSVAAVSSPAQYESVLRELEENDCELKEKTLKFLAGEVFYKVSRYDRVIAAYLSSTDGESESQRVKESEFPEKMNIELEKVRDLRYGENPHQRATFYRDINADGIGIGDAEQLQGKELSFNNILDLAAAFDIARSFDKPAVGIVKHNNPCGVATGDTLEKAWRDALDGDRLSAFGGIMGFNRAIGKDTAGMIIEEAGFIECIIAPGYDEGALKIFRGRKNLRVLRLPVSGGYSPREKDFKKVPRGMLVQDPDVKDITVRDIKWVTRERLAEEMIDTLIFAWKVAKFAKSNAIVLANGTKTVGIGAGSASRVDSVLTAIRKAGERAKGAVLASDGFFPKEDSIEEAHRAGITAVIQPGGSIKDDSIIETCNQLRISMAFTGIRHFRH